MHARHAQVSCLESHVQPAANDLEVDLVAEAVGPLRPREVDSTLHVRLRGTDTDAHR